MTVYQPDSKALRLRQRLPPVRLALSRAYAPHIHDDRAVAASIAEGGTFRRCRGDRILIAPAKRTLWMALFSPGSDLWVLQRLM